MSNFTRVVIGLETQVPYENRRIFRAFLDFVRSYNPHRIVGIGDHLDCPAPARWNRGTAEEYAGNLQREVDRMKGMFGEIRNIHDGPFDVHEGNHERRINTYARTKAPAFASLECLLVPKLLGYSEYEITELPAVAHLSRGWVTTHDLGGNLRSSAKYSGGTALGVARRLGKSVVMGHTHKLGHLQEVVAGRILHGVETGNMMGKASYVFNPNWSTGWVVFEHNNAGLASVTLVNVTPSGVVHFDDKR